MSAALPKRALGKSKFSMYLRTLCDRELYLSLFSNNPGELAAAQIPAPLKSRPGVQLITTSGREFEYEQYDILINALPGKVIHNKNGRANIDLSAALKSATAPALILQPEIEPETFRDVALANIGVATGDLPYIPRLAGLRPDVLLVLKAGTSQFEILPDGSRKAVASTDPRLPICVIDLKNITEANASYSAEVCLYAVFLSNWLASQGKAHADRYFVSDLVYLWRHVELPRFTKIIPTKDGGDHDKRLSALLADLEDGLVSYLIYMPSVRKFFVEDVPRVVRMGDEKGWHAVPYHVNPRCGSCDWLGNNSWLSPDDKKVFDAHPDHYCFHNAEVTDHLSKMAMLSRGAARVLATDGHDKVASIVGMSPTTPTLRKHSLLKKDRAQIGARAHAVTHGATSVDQVSKVGGLARDQDAEYDIIVNFDAGSGFLTGIALRGVLFAPFGQKFPGKDGEPPQSLLALGERDFVVPKDNLQAEWAVLQAFIDQLGDWIDQANKQYAAFNQTKVRTQICFWEARQYEELCNAFGRHLLSILDLPGKTQRALAWLFPAEQLLEREGQVAPAIVFINDVVNGSVRVPQKFALTLLGTAEHYHHDRLTPRTVDRYYLEPLGNAIPRERIFEIWKSPTGTVRSGGKIITVVEAMQRYGRVLRAHAWALASITARLRDDLKSCLDGNAPALLTSIPSGLSSVAHDSKLWDQWAKVSAAVDDTEARMDLIARAEWLEASYKAIVLEKMQKNLGGHRYEFRVSEDSTEAKIEEGDGYCTVGIVSWPGFPIQTGAKLGLTVPPADANRLYAPMHKVIAAQLESFDRVNRTAVVTFRASWHGVQSVFDAVMNSGVLPVGAEPIYLLETLPYDDSEITRDVLRQIGNPKCATTAAEALEAMGKSAAKKISQGQDPDTPIARVLWRAMDLAGTAVRNGAQIAAIEASAKNANPNELNASQLAAVRNCARDQLSIVWGPPGTGKTDTLVAYVQAVVKEGAQRNILITGPNYRTVEELAGRLAANLDGAGLPCDFYWLYSKSRTPKALPATGAHLNLKSFSLATGAPEIDELVASLGNGQRTTIVATTAHLTERIGKYVYNDDDALIRPIFDLTVLDESSQIPVTLALRPFCGLKPTGQVIVAGDHLQMPPIHSLDPPAGAEYLVDSIQTYLIKRFGIERQELLINYRSNQDLVDYAKTLGYPPGLSAFNPKKDLQCVRPIADVVKTLPSGLPVTDAYGMLLEPQRRVTALIHEDALSSQANAIEAGLVAGIAYCVRHAMASTLDTGAGGAKPAFTDDEFFETGIGIVTPHKAQKALVLKELMRLFPNAKPEKVFEAVDTVERFQGGERQTIIVSFGVGDTDIIEGEEAFLLQMERTNVAVSRAMAKYIMLMPKSLAYHLPTDQDAAETAIAIKSYVEEFCGKKQKTEIDFGGVKRDAEVRWR